MPLADAITLFRPLPVVIEKNLEDFYRDIMSIDTLDGMFSYNGKSISRLYLLPGFYVERKSSSTDQVNPSGAADSISIASYRHDHTSVKHIPPIYRVSETSGAFSCRQFLEGLKKATQSSLWLTAFIVGGAFDLRYLSFEVLLNEFYKPLQDAVNNADKQLRHIFNIDQLTHRLDVVDTVLFERYINLYMDKEFKSGKFNPKSNVANAKNMKEVLTHIEDKISKNNKSTRSVDVYNVLMRKQDELYPGFLQFNRSDFENITTRIQARVSLELRLPAMIDGLRNQIMVAKSIDDISSEKNRFKQDRSTVLLSSLQKMASHEGYDYIHALAVLLGQFDYASCDEFDFLLDRVYVPLRNNKQQFEAIFSQSHLNEKLTGIAKHLINLYKDCWVSRFCMALGDENEVKSTKQHMTLMELLNQARALDGSIKLDELKENCALPVMLSTNPNP